jgi:hypothetical protein
MNANEDWRMKNMRADLYFDFQERTSSYALLNAMIRAQIL